MLTRARIIKLLKKLNQKLLDAGVQGEICLMGGAVMCLTFNARASTKDLDAVFAPKDRIRQIVLQIAAEEGLPEDWLNDSVKGFLSNSGTFEPYLELSNLRVLTASADYLLAMKCLSMRIGLEFHDEADVRFLLRALSISSYDKAIEVITRYYPLESLPQKTLYALEELLKT